jgi:F0F1-type ATP synthase assembly protein I
MKFIPFLLLLVLILSMWLLPSATPALGMALILIGLSTAFFSILMKHRTAYRQGKLTRAAFVRSTLLDVLGISLAVVLAGLLGRYVVGLVTPSIDNDTVRVITGIIAGLLVGVGVGLSVNWTWGRLVKTSPGR